MLNSTIVANINGGISSNQKISGGLQSSLLQAVEFEMTNVKRNLTPADQKKCTTKTGSRGSSNIVFNGHNKSLLDQNKNLQAKPLKTVNGNKNSVNSEENIPMPKIFLYEGKITSEWHQSHKIGAGLVNLGNTCFMNTVLQCLTYCPPLANYLLHESDHLVRCKSIGFCMMCELHRHMKKAIESSGSVIKPLPIYQKLKSIAKHFQFGRQEDAHEFLRYVIDHLWKSCISNYSGSKLDALSKETTVINQIFGGYHQSQVTCLRCKEKSNSYDHFMDLILDIKQNVLTLQRALEKFVQPELLQNENAYKCPHCKMKVSAEKKFSVHKLPNVATFQFKRFDYNRVCGGKITKHITYPETLNMRPYMSNPKGGGVNYHLNSVLVHLGATCNSGHYFCYVRNSNGFWYLMDDARVQQVTLNQVLNQNAYVLFYVRSSPAENPNTKRPADHASYLKNNHLLKNGVVGSSNFASTQVPRQSFKPAVLPEISKQSVSQMSSTGLHNSVQRKHILQPLSQNREKVTFSVCSPNPNKFGQNISNPLHSTTSKPGPLMPSSVLNGNLLVPYIEDSSGSSDEDLKNKNTDDNSCYDNYSSSIFLKTRKTALQNCSARESHRHDNAENNTRNISESVSKMKSPLTIKHPGNSVGSLQPNSPKAGQSSINRKKIQNSPSTKQTLFISTTSNDNEKDSSMNNSFESNAACSAKINATTSQWAVTDVSLQSPSIASGSSTNSVNSTTDWSVITDQDTSSRKKMDRNVLSWSAQPGSIDRCGGKLGKTDSPSKVHHNKGESVLNEVTPFTFGSCSNNVSSSSNWSGGKESTGHCERDSKQCDQSVSSIHIPFCLSPHTLAKSCSDNTDIFCPMSTHPETVEENQRLKVAQNESPCPNKKKQGNFRDQSFLVQHEKQPFLVSECLKASTGNRSSKTKASHKRTVSNAVKDDSEKRSTRFSDSDEDCIGPLRKKFKADEKQKHESLSFENYVKHTENDSRIPSMSKESYLNKSSMKHAKTDDDNHQVKTWEQGVSDLKKLESVLARTKKTPMYDEDILRRHKSLKHDTKHEKDQTSASSSLSKREKGEHSNSHIDRSKKYSDNVQSSLKFNESKRKNSECDTRNHKLTDEISPNKNINSEHSRTHGSILNSSAESSGKKSDSMNQSKSSAVPSNFDDIRSDESTAGSSGSSPEYEWVEKTKETVNSDPLKHNTSFHSRENDDIVHQLQKDRNSLFGTNVGTWNRNERSPNYISPVKRNKYQCDEYDEEYDRGKEAAKRKQNKFDGNHHYKRNMFQDVENYRQRERFFDKSRTYSGNRYSSGHQYDNGYRNRRNCNNNGFRYRHHKFSRH